MPRKNRLLFIISSIISAVIFLTLGLLVDKDFFRSFDYQTMVGLQNIITRKVDVPFSIVSVVGSTEITLFVLSVIFIIVFLKKKHIFIGLLLYFFIFIIELFGKLFINHPKPPQMFHRYSLDFSMPSGSIIDTQFSYPSGHMARISFLAVIILFLILFSKNNINKKILSTFLIGLFIIVVFVSRIYLGEHWLSDVIGGLMLGIGIASLSVSFW